MRIHKMLCPRCEGEFTYTDKDKIMRCVNNGHMFVVRCPICCTEIPVDWPNTESVVYCEKCEYFNASYAPDGGGRCMYDSVVGVLPIRNDDDFCSRGKLRKRDAQ